ncbi:MAG: hypothetical protein D3923_13000 [Candidatus Electrothrix sp. AR3]|nr:hypothetical protein [Candidatus Electrothrix sp. AR3]
MIKFEKDGQSLTLPTPDSVKEYVVCILQEKDLFKESSFEKIATLLFEHPERKVELYLETKNKTSKSHLEKLDGFGIICNSTEYYFYKHPKAPDRFVKISNNNYEFDWQKEVVGTRPMFGRTILTLSERKKRELEVNEIIEASNENEKNPVELKPNFMGLGIDLNKAYTWLKKIIKR